MTADAENGKNAAAISVRLAALATSADKGDSNAQTDLEMALADLYRAGRLAVLSDTRTASAALMRRAVETASALFGVHVRDIYGPYRFRFCTRPRFAVYAALQAHGLNVSQIARTADKDARTVANGIARAHYTARREPDYARNVEQLVEALRAYETDQNT